MKTSLHSNLVLITFSMKEVSVYYPNINNNNLKIWVSTLVFQTINYLFGNILWIIVSLSYWNVKTTLWYKNYLSNFHIKKKSFYHIWSHTFSLKKACIMHPYYRWHKIGDLHRLLWLSIKRMRTLFATVCLAHNGSMIHSYRLNRQMKIN